MCSVLTLWPLNSSIGSLRNVPSVNTFWGALCSCISFHEVRLHSKHRSGLVHHGFPSWGLPIGYGSAPCVFCTSLRGQPLSGTHKGEKSTRAGGTTRRLLKLQLKLFTARLLTFHCRSKSMFKSNGGTRQDAPPGEGSAQPLPTDGMCDSLARRGRWLVMEAA